MKVRYRYLNAIATNINYLATFSTIREKSITDLTFSPLLIQVWAGNEACEPVTWRECKLVPRQVDFKVPKITCEDGEDVPYQDMQDAEKTQMTTKMTCEVKHTSNCKPVTSTKCQSITYTECAEIPQETCETVQMQVPKQVRKKVFMSC